MSEEKNYGFVSESFEEDENGRYYLDYKLKYPVRMGDARRENLRVHRVSMGALSESNKQKTPEEKDDALVRSALRMAPDEIKKIDVCDYMAIKMKVVGFLLEAGQDNPQIQKMMEMATKVA